MHVAPRPIRLPLAAACLLLWACGGEPAHEAGLSWNGEPLRVSSRIVKPGIDALRAGGLEALGENPPDRILSIAPGEWGDSLRLLEFGGDVEAYTAFQELSHDAGSASAGVGTCGGSAGERVGERVCFRRGRWIGVIDAWSWRGPGPFDGSLSLPGEEGAGELPKAFESLLYQGRVTGSERILTGEFFGLKITAPVFSVRMDCHGDTAWLYAAPNLDRPFADQLARFPGWRLDTTTTELQVFLESSEFPPAVLRFSRWGAAGVEGCFDEELTKNWLKMQTRGLKSL